MRIYLRKVSDQILVQITNHHITFCGNIALSNWVTTVKKHRFQIFTLAETDGCQLPIERLKRNFSCLKTLEGLITLLLNSGPTLGPRRVVPYSPIKSLEFSF